MKIVKLDRRNRAFKHGFTHAVRFGKGESTVNYHKLKDYLDERYPRPVTFTHWGYRSEIIPYAGKWEAVSSAGHWSKRCHWVCVKNEALLSMALLAINFE